MTTGRMKVIIIGAGISGLSTYLYLRKLVPSITDITIYESHRPRTTSSLESQNYEDLSASTAIVGGGLGVSPNGMYVLKDLDPEIYTAVIEQGFLCDHFTFKGANGWTLSKVPTNDKRQKEGAGLEKCVSSSRHGVWLCLKRKVPDEEIVYRRVSEVGISEDGKPAVKFQDGSPAVIADFVIGADGVKSTVLKAIMGDQYSEIYAPHYEGLAGVGGFLNVDIPSEILQDKSMIFTFGGTGFFGYAAHGSPSNKSLMWWSTFQADIMPEHGTINLADYRKQLVERHGYWKDPVVRKVVELAEFDTVYPTWTTPELPTWSENRVLLIGDAAHALQPTSGQGVSQGLEDSQTLALLLAHYLSDASLNEEDVLKCTAKAMYDIRHPRVTSIAKQARKIDGKKMNQGVFIEYMVYFILWFVPKWPTLGMLLIGDSMKLLYTWNAQHEVKKYIESRKDTPAT